MWDLNTWSSAAGKIRSFGSVGWSLPLEGGWEFRGAHISGGVSFLPAGCRRGEVSAVPAVLPCKDGLVSWNLRPNKLFLLCGASGRLQCVITAIEGDYPVHCCCV